MKRSSASVTLALVALALAAASAALPSRADTVLYRFAALRGPVATCVWFDDQINDRSLGAIIRQTDLLYNRTALIPGTDVTNVQTAPIQSGTLVAGFETGNTQLCSGDDAINPAAPVPEMPVEPPSS